MDVVERPLLSQATPAYDWTTIFAWDDRGFRDARTALDIDENSSERCRALRRRFC